MQTEVNYNENLGKLKVSLLVQFRNHCQETTSLNWVGSQQNTAVLKYLQMIFKMIAKRTVSNSYMYVICEWPKQDFKILIFDKNYLVHRGILQFGVIHKLRLQILDFFNPLPC